MGTFTIDLTGGPPWGFSMAGGSDFNQPLNISKVAAGGKATLRGVRPGLAILRVNGQDVTNLRHMDATQFVKEVSRSGTLSLTLDASSLRQEEDLNSILGGISAVPTMYRGETETIKTDFIEYRPIDHNESKRRIFEDSANSGEQWRPNAYQSTQQSPSFIKAVKAPSSNGSGTNLSEPIKLDFNPELQSMINSEDQERHAYQTSPKPCAPKISAPKMTAPVATQPIQSTVKTFSPVSAPVRTSPPAKQVMAPITQPSQPQYHDLRNPQKNGILRLPTVNYPKAAPPTVDAKTNALGNISSFMNKQSGGAVSRGTLGRPEFLQGLIDRECPIGEPFVLEVRLAGSSPISIQWYRNNQPVRESIERDVRILQKGNVYTLVYGELTRQELGRYTCQASNNKGTVTTACTIMEGGYDELTAYPTATYQHGPPAPSNPAYAKTVPTHQAGLPARTKVITKKPIDQLVTSGNANLYSSNAIEEGLHSALGIQPDHTATINDESAVLAAIEGRDQTKRHTSRTLARLAQQLDEDL